MSLYSLGVPLHSFNAFTASVCNLNPTSRGTVRITSGRPTDAPAIQANYLSTEADRLVAADSLRLTRRGGIGVGQVGSCDVLEEVAQPGHQLAPLRRGSRGAAGDRQHDEKREDTKPGGQTNLLRRATARRW